MVAGLGTSRGRPGRGVFSPSAQPARQGIKNKKIGGIIMMKKIKMLMEIEKTRKGFPATWECGGGYTNTGEAIIVASQSGGPKRPIYLRRRGHLANDNHALFVLELGDYIIEAKHRRR